MNKEEKKKYDRAYYAKNSEKKKTKFKEYYKNNKNKVNEKNREWNQANKRVAKNAKLRKNFGISIEQYEQLKFDQHYMCRGCGRHEEKLDRELAVDHDHTTGEIRGLLCSECNLALGLVKDNTDTLKRLIDYLKLYQR